MIIITNICNSTCANYVNVKCTNLFIGHCLSVGVHMCQSHVNQYNVSPVVVLSWDACGYCSKNWFTVMFHVVVVSCVGVLGSVCCWGEEGVGGGDKGIFMAGWPL